MMFWSDKLAASAQRHADRCDFRHSTDRVKTGENIWAAPYENYSDAVRLWYQEVHDPYCGCQHAYKHCCGHYVQVRHSYIFYLQHCTRYLNRIPRRCPGAFFFGSPFAGSR
jgi:hypothetical protein